ncbi:hypothetical protein AAHA92_18046 [Salvia divinorum]|uniref:Uncharacterized protein n=1 Tax=Salvia divinorum TaxID=28513 RepID=A0ABD1H4V5_SALDI
METHCTNNPKYSRLLSFY